MSPSDPGHQLDRSSASCCGCCTCTSWSAPGYHWSTRPAAGSRPPPRRPAWPRPPAPAGRRRRARASTGTLISGKQCGRLGLEHRPDDLAVMVTLQPGRTAPSPRISKFASVAATPSLRPVRMRVGQPAGAAPRHSRRRTGRAPEPSSIRRTSRSARHSRIHPPSMSATPATPPCRAARSTTTFPPHDWPATTGAGPRSSPAARGARQVGGALAGRVAVSALLRVTVAALVDRNDLVPRLASTRAPRPTCGRWRTDRARAGTVGVDRRVLRSASRGPPGRTTVSSYAFMFRSPAGSRPPAGHPPSRGDVA